MSLSSLQPVLPNDLALLGLWPTAETVRDRRTVRARLRLGDRVDHLGLAFYRFAPKDTHPTPDERPSDLKSTFLRALADRFTPDPDAPWARALQAANDRAEATRQGLRDARWAVRTLDVVTRTRFVAGLGYASAVENGITLHPLLGTPYLPGTSVKGLARAWNETVLQPAAGGPFPGHHGPPTPDTLDLRARLLQVCGSDVKDPRAATLRGGQVRFFDALPTAFPRLEVDVMTVHEPDYYRTAEPPADQGSPNPVPFLTVAAGTPFRFWLAARDPALADDALAWLTLALDRLGAGAKTAAGYGTMAPTHAPPGPQEADAVRKAWRQTRTDRETRQAAADAERRRLGPDRVETPLAKGDAVRAVVLSFSRKKGNARVALAADGYDAHPGAPTPVCTGLGGETLVPGEWVRVTVNQLNYDDVVTVVHFANRTEPGTLHGLTPPAADETAPEAIAPEDTTAGETPPDDAPAASAHADPNRGVVTAVTLKKGRVRLTVRADTGDDLQAWDDGAGLAEGQRVRFEREDRGGAAWASDLRPE